MELIFGVHNHQPYGNFIEVFEETYKTAYYPFIESILDSDAKVILHFTGTLLEWLNQSHREYIDKVKTLLKEDRVEILSGGFYEPIMPAIPSKFRVKQIQKMNKLIYETFSYTPKGLWLAERVWESSIIPDLKKAGIEYTFLDEENFIPIDKRSDRYYLTEYDGVPFKVFVIDKELRYLIPFKDQIETIKKLKNGKFFTALDDGEKFGAWPGTYHLIYESEWLKNFFDTLKNNNVKMLLPQDIFNDNKYCGGLVYLDSGSYPEMQEWALPEKNKKTGKKCNWKNFFVKYSESNFMHKLNLLNCKYYSSESEEESIMASQANDAYWHGVFGGIYISHLRSAIYKNIVNVQRGLIKNPIVEDVDFDGYKEILIKNENFILGIDPDEGGRIFELANVKKEYNFQNTLTRRRESYHKEEQIKDWYDKFSLIDHFFQFPSFEKIKNCEFEEIGDFVNNPYSFEINNKKVLLKRDGNIWFHGKLIPLTVQKELQFLKDEIVINYSIINKNNFEVQFHFATEFNFNFVSDSGEERFIKYGNEVKGIKDEYDNDTNLLTFEDKFFDLKLSILFDKSRVWSYPIKTVAMSEKDKIESYQGTSIFINKVGKLSPNSQCSQKFIIK